LNWLHFVPGFVLGLLIGKFCFSERFTVAIHEYKHFFWAKMMGNQAKVSQVRMHTGKVEFKYTKDTEAYNAFVALAPYILPVFTVLCMILSLLIFREDHAWAVLGTALGVGIDLILNFKDVSPTQSDIYLIRGGYTVGLMYIVFMNFALASILAFWISRDWIGLRELGLSWWHWAVRIADLISG
jgi:hypothetical protein